jgi:hypothetical protein
VGQRVERADGDDREPCAERESLRHGARDAKARERTGPGAERDGVALRERQSGFREDRHRHVEDMVGMAVAHHEATREHALARCQRHRAPGAGRFETEDDG